MSNINLDANSSSPASEIQGGNISAPGQAEPALLSTSTGLSLGHGGCGHRRQMHVPLIMFTSYAV